MKNRKKRVLLGAVSIMCAVVVAAVLFTAGKPCADEKNVYKSLDILCDVITIIQRDYIEKVDSGRLIADAVRGMLSSLDSYSSFVPAPAAGGTPVAEPVKALDSYGLEVSYRDRLLTVIAPLEGGPAWRSGLKSGDVIVKIDGEPFEEKPVAELLRKFRSGATQEIQLEVLRRGERDFLDFTVPPGKIEGPPARAETLGDNVGLLRVSRFDGGTAAGVEECLKGLKADGLIIDLRDCPAGDVMAAIDAANYFIPEGQIITRLEGRVAGSSREFRARGKPILGKMPCVVLVNGGTSGAAEILAGALRDGRRAVLMGQASFGCAFEARTFSLKGGAAITMMTAVYQTPGGDEIQDEGLAVDIDVPLKIEAAEIEEEEGIEREKVPEVKGEKAEGMDPLVQRAVDLIKGIRIVESRKES